MRTAGSGTQQGRVGRPLGGGAFKGRTDPGADAPLGARLRFARVAARMSMERLAQETGIYRDLLSDFEVGLKSPEPELEAALWRAVRLHAQKVVAP